MYKEALRIQPLKFSMYLKRSINCVMFSLSEKTLTIASEKHLKKKKNSKAVVKSCIHLVIFHSPFLFFPQVTIPINTAPKKKTTFRAIHCVYCFSVVTKKSTIDRPSLLVTFILHSYMHSNLHIDSCQGVKRLQHL